MTFVFFCDIFSIVEKRVSIIKTIPIKIIFDVEILLDKQTLIV